MATKIFRKEEIRRAVYGTCLVDAPVGGCSVEAAPIQVTVSVRRRRGCCGRLPGAWREAAAFSFVDRPRAPFLSNAFLDLEHVFRYSSEADAAAAQVKICLTLLSGQTHVAKVGLEDFLDQLTQSGRPECFTLYIYEGKVALLQTRQPSPEVLTEWLFDGKGNDTHKGSRYKDSACYDPEVTDIDQWEEKMNTSDSAREENSDVSAWETAQEESDVSAWETAQEESDVSAWETAEEDTEESVCDSCEESGLDIPEDTDKESRWESEDGDSEKESEREAPRDSDESGSETLDEGAEEEAGRGTAGGTEERGGGRGFLARLGAAWWDNRLALLLAAAEPDEWRWGGGGWGL